MTRTLLAVAAAAGFAALSPAQVSFSNVNGDYIAVKINGRAFSNIYIGSTYPKPFIAPLRTATGIIVTRRYPMKLVPGESRDHPHHRALFIGYGNINGINFWENERKEKPNPHNPLKRGDMVVEKIEGMSSGSKLGRVILRIGWRDPSGNEVLRERRIMTFYANEKIRRFDVYSRLTAVRQAKFADTKEGFFAIRVADSMNGKHGGTIRNSKGAEGEKNVWGKRADWATYEGTVDGQKVGIAILDSPLSYNHPPRWHARAYGLFAVNPFGVKQFDPEATTPGGYTLEPGKSLRFRYRVIIYTGTMPTSTVAGWYSDFAGGPGR